MEDVLNFAGNRFRSRLIVGTGKYKDFQETKKAIEVSGAVGRVESLCHKTHRGDCRLLR